MADGALNTVFTKNLIKYKILEESKHKKKSLQLLGELKMFSFWVNHPSGEFLCRINKVTLQDAVANYKLISFPEMHT
jgi:hypothetical protein